MGGLNEATEYEFRIFAENETGFSRPRRTPMGIKTKLSGKLMLNIYVVFKKRCWYFSILYIQDLLR